MSDILIRSFTLERAALVEDGDGRTLAIQAVPWDTEVRISATEWESFDPHTFDAQIRAANRVPLTLGHPTSSNGSVNSPEVDLRSILIGGLTTMESRGEGLHVTARAATTAVANDALTLYKDGVLDQVSVGFFPLAKGTVRQERPGGGVLLRRVAARLDHLALVVRGAYGADAKILASRAEDDAETKPPEGPSPAEQRAAADAARARDMEFARMLGRHRPRG
jgi:phage head maturation protease